MVGRRSILTGLSASLALGAIAKSASASDAVSARPHETIAILGAGKLGGALGKRLAAVGYPVIYGSRTPDAERVQALVKSSSPNASAATLRDAVARSSIVVFALPWEPVKDLLPKLGELSGKLLIDPMNAAPRIIDGYPFRPDTATSVAEELQRLVPGASVVKAFNAISANDLTDSARASGPISIPLAGAEGDPKKRVLRLVSNLGLDPVDFGPLVVARYIEDLLWFEVACVRHNKKLFEIYMRPMPAGLI
jgi:predicted dinucleotide-binding enzyme